MHGRSISPLCCWRHPLVPPTHSDWGASQADRMQTDTAAGSTEQTPFTENEMPKSKCGTSRKGDSSQKVPLWSTASWGGGGARTD